MHAFLGDEIYKLTENGISPGYPQRIKSVFKELPGNMDAAFTWSNDKSYFFKVDNNKNKIREKCF